MNPGPAHIETQITRYEGLAAVDAAGTSIAPATLLIAESNLRGQLPRLLAIGTPDEVRGHPAWGTARLERHGKSILLPGFVNAHTHLDLTHMGPRPFDESRGFVGWAEMVRLGRCVEEAGIMAAVGRGVELSLAGGVVAVGDIAGAAGGRPCLAPLRALQASPLLGVSFLEFFGIGNRLAAAVAGLEGWVAGAAASPDLLVRAGLQPHAPYSVDLRLYLAAVEVARRHGLPMATHLAETLEEREFVSGGTGPKRAFLERLGVWDEGVMEQLGHGKHPVAHLEPALEGARFLVAHVNDCDDGAIQTLAKTGTSVAYCPRASAYFGAERALGPHRYRDMVEAGVNVCLGTDSIINLPADAADRGMSVLDEARVLYRRDGTDARLLLKMATMNGAAALGLDPGWFRFRAGEAIAGLVAVEVSEAPAGTHWAESVLRSDARARLLAHRSASTVAGAS